MGVFLSPHCEPTPIRCVFCRQPWEIHNAVRLLQLRRLKLEEVMWLDGSLMGLSRAEIQTRGDEARAFHVPWNLPVEFPTLIFRTRFLSESPQCKHSYENTLMCVCFALLL